MSKALPLWENDESDVKLEHRCQYGHVLLRTEDIDLVLKRIRSILRLGRPKMLAQEIDQKSLPWNREEGICVLDTSTYWHFILARLKSNIAIFAPHFLFHNNANWIKLSRRLKVQMSSVHQLDLESFGYIIFNKGKHICGACRDLSGIHESVPAPMEFYLEGTLIAKIDDETGRFTEDMINFLSDDVVLQSCEDQQLRFVTPLSREIFQQPSAIRHAIFPSKKSMT